jgi:repressor of nif and glnA expression
MAEFFAKTFKKDNVHTDILTNAGIIMKQLLGGLVDYNEKHPLGHLIVQPVA